MPRPEAEALRLATAHARQSFDLTAGPLFRSHVLRIADDVHLLAGDASHRFDGWSLGILASELSALYTAYAAGHAPSLPSPGCSTPTTRSGTSGACLRRAGLAAGLLDPALAGAPTLLELPTDRPRPAQLSGRGACHDIAIAPEATCALGKLCAQEGTTLAMAIQAIFAMLLARYSGSRIC